MTHQLTIERRRPRRRVSVAALAALSLAASACSGSSSEADKSKRAERPADSATTATSRPAPVQDAVIAGYRAFWDAYLAAADPMNPEDPRLVEHATGEELETLQKAFLARRSAGEVIRGTLELAPRVATVNAEGTGATVTDCYADHTGVYDAATGARKDKESGVRHLVRVEMALVGGVWRVARLTLEADGCTPAQ